MLAHALPLVTPRRASQAPTPARRSSAYAGASGCEMKLLLVLLRLSTENLGLNYRGLRQFVAVASRRSSVSTALAVMNFTAELSL